MLICEEMRVRRRQFVCQLTSLTGGVAALGLSGCGTIFYRERIDQPRSRDIDWEVAALDGLGLVFFFVPGVIAFIVDFYTGAIYLPPKRTASHSTAVESDFDQASDLPIAQWHRVNLAPADLRSTQIEHAVSKQLASPFSLADSLARASGLSKLEQHANQYQRHQRDSNYGVAANAFFGKMTAHLKSTVTAENVTAEKWG